MFAVRCREVFQEPGGCQRLIIFYFRDGHREYKVYQHITVDNMGAVRLSPSFITIPNRAFVPVKRRPIALITRNEMVVRPFVDIVPLIQKSLIGCQVLDTASLSGRYYCSLHWQLFNEVSFHVCSVQTELLVTLHKYIYIYNIQNIYIYNILNKYQYAKFLSIGLGKYLGIREY